ncbi:conserved Plasmodium protein, unknown function [Plasmodium ovale]|uniref:Uncharacterized protein n=2 Tax=Plasmodium ovale TaxID=36330 RepID=A0A1A8X3L8_PLAOA|nr:conserved Plasmodium protein, unknown function [Plasmodium ovale curtisi]SBS99194.1 conserved Plasmodium protein, unknown function [Plasmodium ovale curtisi]SCQ16274.1 conserved Plasmodium protein, unknown function [Plasmodium ovale]
MYPLRKRLTHQGPFGVFRSLFSCVAEGVEEILSDDRGRIKWKKEIEKLRKEKSEKDDVNVKYLNYVIMKEKRRKRKEAQTTAAAAEVEGEKEIDSSCNVRSNAGFDDDFNAESDAEYNGGRSCETINLFSINSCMKNVNLKKKEMYALDECMSYYDKWNVVKINYKNSKTDETKEVVLRGSKTHGRNDSKNIYHIDNYYDIFEKDEEIEDARKENSYNKLFEEDDPRLMWDVQNDLFFSNEDIYFFNNFNDSNYSQFLETIDWKKNVYFNYLDRRKPIKFLSKGQIVEVLNRLWKDIINQENVHKKRDYAVDIILDMHKKAGKGNIHFNSFSGQTSTFPNDISILQEVVAMNYEEEKNNRTVQGERREFYTNLINRAEFISLSFSIEESILVLSFFYLNNFLPFVLLNKFIQNFLTRLHLLNTEHILVLLKIYGTWKDNYEDFVHVLLVYFFNRRDCRGGNESDNSGASPRDMFFLKICLHNSIRINNSLAFFYAQPNLSIYQREHFLLLFRSFFHLTDRKNSQLFCKAIHHFPLCLKTFHSLKSIPLLRDWMHNQGKYPHSKFTPNELEIVISSLCNMDASEFYQSVKGYLTCGYRTTKEEEKNEKRKELLKYPETQSETHSRSNLLLNANIIFVAFRTFGAIVANVRELMVFPLFSRIDLFHLTKDSKMSESRIEVFRNNILFDCLVKEQVQEGGGNISEEKCTHSGVTTPVRLTGDDVRSLFVCEKESLNHFLYHYEKIAIRKIPLSFIVNCIHFINEYVVPFRNILHLSEKVIDDILFLLSFLYIKFYVLMNSLSGKNKKVLLLYFPKIIPPIHYMGESETVEKKEKLEGSKYWDCDLTSSSEKVSTEWKGSSRWRRSFFLPYYNLTFAEEKMNYHHEKRKSCKGGDYSPKNNYLLSNTIFNTLFLIFHNFLDNINIYFDASAIVENVGRIVETVLLYIHYFEGEKCNYKDNILKHYPFCNLDNSCTYANSRGGDTRIPEESKSLLHKLMEKLSSFFSLYVSLQYQSRLTDEEVIHFAKILSLFAVCLHLREPLRGNNCDKIIEKVNEEDHWQTTDTREAENTGKEKRGSKISGLYGDAVHAVITDLRKMDFSELTELKKLTMFEAVTRMFVLYTVNNISCDEMALLLNGLMQYVLQNRMHISGENYYLVRNACQNLKTHSTFFRGYPTFDWTSYERLQGNSTGEVAP